MPKISVLILAKNEADNIDRCLKAVFNQRDVEDYEVLLLDSGSQDSTLEIARTYPVKITQIDAASFHHSRTRNLAASLASGDLLVYLAADAWPTSNGWLRALSDGFCEPSVGAVYGRHVPKVGASRERQSALNSLYGDTRLVKRPGENATLGYKFYHFSTVNAAIRRSAWEATKFPDDLKVFEDVAIAKRMLDSGWSIVYEPMAAVFHSHDYPVGVLFKRYFDIGVVYQRLGIWNQNSRNTVRGEGWRALRRKLSDSINPMHTSTMLSSILRDGLKFIGMELGRNEKLLPLPLKRRLSQFKLFD